MDAYSLLRREIREYIFDEGWEDLRPIQKVAISRSVTTNNNFILAAPTASGKTEAAFLPAINNVSNFKEGVKILYISPLRALINDQFERITKLCSYLDINVTSWHGEASRNKKEKLLENPNGILLITPESIEAMLTLHPGKAKTLFSSLEWIIVDEIHSFLGSNRGIHLKSLLMRLSKYIVETEPRYIGMSATLNKDDYPLVKNYFTGSRTTDVLLDKTKNELITTIFYSQENIKKESFEAIEEIYKYSLKESMLVFPNSRREVERISVSLKKLKEQENSEVNYFAHHSSVTKEERLLTEQFAKKADGELFTIVCTSTLELGIDIGSVDSVVQYNAPHQVASLGQRLGRSGRKSRQSKLHLISTDPWQLVASLSVLNLYHEGFIERNEDIYKPYDVFAHQILASLMESSGIKLNTLYNYNKYLRPFNDITNEETSLIIDYLVKNGFIEILEDEAIIGRKSEKLLFKGEFFALFETEHNFSVYSRDKKVGEVPISPTIRIGENIYLSAKVWKIVDIDYRREKISVETAKDGKPPIFEGLPGFVSNEIRQNMKRILSMGSSVMSDIGYDQEEIKDVITYLVEHDNIKNGFNFVREGESVSLRTFMGTRVNLTLVLLLNLITDGFNYNLHDPSSTIYGPEIRGNLCRLLENFPSINTIKSFIFEYRERFESQLTHLKYKILIPEELRVEYLMNNIFDIEGLLKYLKESDV